MLGVSKLSCVVCDNWEISAGAGEGDTLRFNPDIALLCKHLTTHNKGV